METQVLDEKSKAKFLLDVKKVEKYYRWLLNGESFKLNAWLPNLISTGGFVDRERYEWRISHFKRKEPVKAESKYVKLMVALEKAKMAECEAAALLEKAKAEFLAELVEYKVAVDDFYNKNKMVDC